jgi:hypothetical protein
MRGVLLRGVRRGVVLRPFAMESREEVDGPRDSRTGAIDPDFASIDRRLLKGVRFVPGFVSDETRRGWYTLRHWRGRPENIPQGTSHE